MGATFTQNEILGRLPDREQEALRERLTPIVLHTRDELNQPGSPLRYLYFPLTAAISVIDMQPDGRTVEVAVVGHEGCMCPQAVDGLAGSPSYTIVEVGGAALRIDVAALTAMPAEVPILTRMIRRYGALLFREVVISVGCSQFHSVEQRLARWLLAHHHRTGAMTFPFTHEFLAGQLGAQRVTVTEALADFQGKGLVTYGYGKVQLLDLQRLKRTTCECFSLVTQAIDEYRNDIATSGPP
jgi:CRP-like cAMP-binding protein